MVLLSKKEYVNHYGEVGYCLSLDDVNNARTLLSSLQIRSKFEMPEEFTLDEAIRTHKVYKAMLSAFDKQLAGYNEDLQVINIKNEMKKLLDIDNVLVSQKIDDLIKICILPWYFLSKYDLVRSCCGLSIPPRINEITRKKKAIQNKKFILEAEDRSLLEVCSDALRGNKKNLIFNNNLYSYLEEKSIGEKIRIKDKNYVLKKIYFFPRVIKTYQVLVIAIKDNDNMQEIMEKISVLNEAKAIQFYLTQNFSSCLEGKGDEVRVAEDSQESNDQNILYAMANRTKNVFIYNDQNKKRIFILKNILINNPSIKIEKDDFVSDSPRLLVSKISDIIAENNT